MSDRAVELEEFQTNLQALVEEAPELESFLGFVESAETTATLSNKTKELMSLAIGVVLRCRPCILWHTNGALDAGASEQEVVDALKVVVVMGGGPALAYATEAHEVLQDLHQ